MLIGQEDTAEFLADNKVHIIASLPCYSSKNVNLQRGKGVFDKSIQALLLLNSLGYGKEDTGLKLDLMYNPLGKCEDVGSSCGEYTFKQSDVGIVPWDTEAFSGQ